MFYHMPQIKEEKKVMFARKNEKVLKYVKQTIWPGWSLIVC